MTNRADKFLQPIDAIEVVSRAASRTLLTEEAIEAGRRRVAEGEDLDAVATELAMLEVELLDEGEDDDALELRGLAGDASARILHDVADAHVPKLSVAFRYAFAAGRKTLKPLLAGLRTATFNPDQPRDERGQWTDDGGSVYVPVDEANLKDGAYIVRGQIQYRYDRDYTEPNAVFRGITSREAAFIVREGKIESDKSYSHSSEGTSYGDTLAFSESIVNVGRDNPYVTGRPTFVVQVGRGPEHVVDKRDDIVKSDVPIPASRIERVWRFDPDGKIGTYTSLDEAVKTFRGLGGSGSGNFGHAGRPGHVGGSSSGFDSPDRVPTVPAKEFLKLSQADKIARSAKILTFDDRGTSVEWNVKARARLTFPGQEPVDYDAASAHLRANVRDGVLTLVSVHVDEGLRRQGVATRLVRLAGKLADERGLELKTSGVFSSDGRKLFESMGFKDLAAHPTDVAARAIQQALDEVLAPMLLRCAADGGAFAAGRLPAVRAAADNCGTGAGGFQPGNTCAKGGDGASAYFDVPQDFALEDAQYDVNTRFPRNLMVVAEVDLSLLSSEYGNDYRVREMTNAIRQGAKFPPLTLEQKKDGTLNILDGRTRVAAFREAGIKGRVSAVVRLYDEGTEGALPKGVTIDDKRTTSLRKKSIRGAAVRAAADNCGTGTGGFQPGNTCAKGSGEAGGSSSVSGAQVKSVVYYHGTADDILERVKSEGLRPAGSPGSDAWHEKTMPSMFAAFGMGDREASVYLAKNAEDSLNYASYASRTRGGSAVVLEVHVPADQEASLLQKDEHDRYGFRTRSGASIPAEWIKRVGVQRPTYPVKFEWRGLAETNKIVIYLVVMVDEGGNVRSAAAKLSFKFNREHAAVVAWAKKHAAELVTDVSETSRKRIRSAIASLTEGGDWNEATERILKAVGDEDRAELIARHETMQAASEGQRQAWAQAVEEGALDDAMRRTWITTPDGKLCPVCEELDGKTADLDGGYPGGIVGPPAHVACRCTEGLT